MILNFTKHLLLYLIDENRNRFVLSIQIADINIDDRSKRLHNRSDLARE